MISYPEIITILPGQYGKIFQIANIAAVICVIIILLAILADFIHYHRPRMSKRKKNSLVETGSMMLYFLIYCLLLPVHSGRIALQPAFLINMAQLTGLVFLIAGCIANVAGRITLRHNWANQVTIYPDQTLVTGNIYRFVRHPLYASLIWMLLGGCLIYLSWMALLSVILVFIPMMYFRARQEEKFLLGEFSEYADYMKRTGMLFPKILSHEKL